jgi:hypothetical protein
MPSAATRSKTFDRALSLIAAILVIAIIVVVRYRSELSAQHRTLRPGYL